ncbi:unnamed protein product, partial [Ectocarpus sp. 12 AP-2014]
CSQARSPSLFCFLSCLFSQTAKVYRSLQVFVDRQRPFNINKSTAVASRATCELARQTNVCRFQPLPPPAGIHTEIHNKVVMSSPPAAGGSSPGPASATTAPSISTIAGAASSVSSGDSAAKGVIDGFAPRKYSAPWWATNDHFSTIFGSGEIQKRFGVKGPEVVYRRERWNTPDGDFLDVDFLDT